MRAKRGGNGAAPECKGGGELEIPEKTRRPVESSATIPAGEYPRATSPGIEPAVINFTTNKYVSINLYLVYKSCVCRGYVTPASLFFLYEHVFKFKQTHSVPLRGTLTERLACSPSTKAIRVQSPAGSLRVFACGNRAGRYRWSAGYLGDLQFSPSFHSVVAPYSITLIGSRDLGVESRQSQQHLEYFQQPLHTYACENNNACHEDRPRNIEL
ncbi:hypothetical protein PR048_021277 [Dryococelus australis]|uniref:Uncharacterized protein n=1 Tax=Dryococelus australis TaxID=614101 RepID=A0ABQ9GXT8_9NEOP|nr:hypothetical protein PR048_021277 [Dryococelus australis]